MGSDNPLRDMGTSINFFPGKWQHFSPSLGQRLTGITHTPRREVKASQISLRTHKLMKCTSTAAVKVDNVLVTGSACEMAWAAHPSTGLQSVLGQLPLRSH